MGSWEAAAGFDCELGKILLHYNIVVPGVLMCKDLRKLLADDENVRTWQAFNFTLIITLSMCDITLSTVCVISLYLCVISLYLCVMHVVIMITANPIVFTAQLFLVLYWSQST